MNLQQMKYIVYISRYHSISMAARKLFVTQPNLSNAVKELEKELGVQIFERKKNGVALTREGVEFVASIQPIVQQVELIEEKYRQKEQVEYTLDVACQHSNFVGDVLCELLEEKKDSTYHVSFLEIKTKEILEYLEYGMCDIGVLLRNKNNKVLEWEIEKRRLEFHLLAELKPHVFLQKNHLLAEKDLITEEDLKPYPYIRYDQGLNNSRFFSEDLIENHHVQKVITITDKMANMNFARYLQAYTLGSGLQSKRFSSDSVVSVPYDSDEVIELGWIISREKTQSNLCKNFIELLEKAVREQIL